MTKQKGLSYYGKGVKRHRAGVMNKLEAEYAKLLDERGVKYIFESVKLKVGAKICWYCPDFLVFNEDMEIEFHEVKGFWLDKARVKYQSAARQFPQFRFFSAEKAKKKDGGHWIIKECPPD